ncbi:MAG: sulfotransferase [Cyclobacteriaceae bacterium]
MLQQAENLYEQQRVAKTKIANGDFDGAIKLLEATIAQYPEALTAKVLLLPLIGRRGPILHYRQQLASLLDQLKGNALSSVDLGRRFLTSIQYACTYEERSKSLSLLIEATRKATKKHPNDLDFTLLLIELWYASGSYTQMIAQADHLIKSEIKHPKLNSLNRVIRKVQHPKYPDMDRPKIFGIGLSRTGTTSLNKALQVLGFHSIHWTNPHTKDLIGGSDYFQFDAFTDITTSYNFEELYRRFPNAKFIYTPRAVADWVRSMEVHHRNYRGISDIAQLNNANNMDRFRGKASMIASQLFTQYSSWKVAYEIFHDRVNSFFESNNRNRLLVLDVCGGEGWEKLCGFMDVTVPDVEFPTSNQTPKHIR